MKHVLCSNGCGIDEKVRSVNRSWTPDSYFSLRKPIHRRGFRGKMSRGHVRIPQSSHLRLFRKSGTTDRLGSNRSWTPDSYFNVISIRGRRFPVLSPGAGYPSYATAADAAIITWWDVVAPWLRR